MATSPSISTRLRKCLQVWCVCCTKPYPARRISSKWSSSIVMSRKSVRAGMMRKEKEPDGAGRFGRLRRRKLSEVSRSVRAPLGYPKKASLHAKTYKVWMRAIRVVVRVGAVSALWKMITHSQQQANHWRGFLTFEWRSCLEEVLLGTKVEQIVKWAKVVTTILIHQSMASLGSRLKLIVQVRSMSGHRLLSSHLT